MSKRLPQHVVEDIKWQAFEKSHKKGVGTHIIHSNDHDFEVKTSDHGYILANYKADSIKKIS